MPRNLVRMTWSLVLHIYRSIIYIVPHNWTLISRRSTLLWDIETYLLILLSVICSRSRIIIWTIHVNIRTIYWLKRLPASFQVWHERRSRQIIKLLSFDFLHRIDELWSRHRLTQRLSIFLYWLLIKLTIKSGLI